MSKLTHSITHILMPIHFSSARSSKGIIEKFSSTDISRENLIKNDRITKIYLGLEKIGLPIHGFTDIAFFIPRLFLPAEIPIISGKRWLHANLFLETESGYNICLEYGAYKGEDMTDDKKHNYKTYYFDKRNFGVRFAEMDFNTYKKDKLNYDSYSERIFTLYPWKDLTLNNALTICNYYGDWTYDKYDLATHNCQDFAAIFIRVTGAYRNKGEEYRGLHNIASAKIPKCILLQIERNEDDVWNTIGVIPIFGPLIGGIHGLISKITGKWD